MRGSDERTERLCSYVNQWARARGSPVAGDPVGSERGSLNDGEATSRRSTLGLNRPSIASKKLLRAMLLQAFYSIRSERQLMERLEFDLLFRWFVGLASTRGLGRRLISA